jgi:cell division protein FtsZ
MSGMGLAMMGTGIAEGPDRAMEAARRAISSPLLEGASVNGARGVIINVTGGPDLSLVEVSEASCIVQEAADEEANIIFGAVVDPTLTGRVKITVIATGFDPYMAARPEASSAQTPVDMTQYSDTRARSDAPVVPVASPMRLSIARRSLVDAPLVPASRVVGTAAAAAAATAAAAEAPRAALDADTPQQTPESGESDFDFGTSFDVPAFLRRQEG